MSEEVKRLQDHIEQFENHNPGQKARVGGNDGKIYYHADFAVLLSDKIAKKQNELNSTRQALADTKAQLKALEDHLDLYFGAKSDIIISDLIDQAIQNSRARKQG